jgi:hypothetical protein
MNACIHDGTGVEMYEYDAPYLGTVKVLLGVPERDRNSNSRASGTGEYLRWKDRLHLFEM